MVCAIPVDLRLGMQCFANVGGRVIDSTLLADACHEVLDDGMVFGPIEIDAKVCFTNFLWMYCVNKSNARM